MSFHVFCMPASLWFADHRYGVRFGNRSIKPGSNVVVNVARYMDGVKFIQTNGLLWAGHLGGNDRIKKWATQNPRPWWFLSQYPDTDPVKVEVLEIIARDQLAPIKTELLWKAANHLEYLARVSGIIQPDKIVVDLIGHTVKIVVYHVSASYQAAPL